MQTVWKGLITFGLVNVPVKLFTATEDSNVPMKMIHKKYGEPIRYTRTCPKCQEEVRWDEIVKGYEYEPGHYVTFEKEELEELGSEDKREIHILDFVDLEEIDPIYFQKTYFIAPDESGIKAYKLLRKALQETGKIGVANITMRQKSSLAAIRFLRAGQIRRRVQSTPDGSDQPQDRGQGGQVRTRREEDERHRYHGCAAGQPCADEENGQAG